MKLAVIYRPRQTPPFEAVPEMLDGVAQWIEKYGDRFEASADRVLNELP